MISRLSHLAARFFASLRARPVDAATASWVAGTLEPPEMQTFDEMSRADRAEAVDVARRLEAALAGTNEAGDTRWLAAALVHDAGKQLSGYGTVARVAVTVVATVVGEGRVRRWATADQPMRLRPTRCVGLRRMGQYVAHDDLGAELLRRRGARSEVVAWASAHHRPERWGETGIPTAVCRALAAADGEPIER